MHEMSIAVELMSQLEGLAREHGLERIAEVTVTAGSMRGIVPEALQIAFAAVAEGSCAEGASLELEFVTALALCRRCGHRFEPEAASFLCERCGEADVEIVQGNDIVLSSISGDKK